MIFNRHFFQRSSQKISSFGRKRRLNITFVCYFVNSVKEVPSQSLKLLPLPACIPPTLPLLGRISLLLSASEPSVSSASLSQDIAADNAVVAFGSYSNLINKNAKEVLHLKIDLKSWQRYAFQSAFHWGSRQDQSLPTQCFCI